MNIYAPIYFYVDGDHDLEVLPETDGMAEWAAGLVAGCQDLLRAAGKGIVARTVTFELRLELMTSGKSRRTGCWTLGARLSKLETF